MCVCVCVTLAFLFLQPCCSPEFWTRRGGRPGVLGVGSQPEAPYHWQMEHQVLAGQVVPLRRACTPSPPALLNSYSPSWLGSREQVEMGPAACQVLELPIHCFLLPCYKVPTFSSFYPHLPPPPSLLSVPSYPLSVGVWGSVAGTLYFLLQVSLALLCVLC